MSAPGVYTHYLPKTRHRSSTLAPISPTSDTPIEHYLDRLNQSYRQITTRERNKHAYDLYNNDDFYIRKYGDFYLADKTSRKISNQCELHGSGRHETYTEPTRLPTSRHDRISDKVF